MHDYENRTGDGYEKMRMTRYRPEGDIQYSAGLGVPNLAGLIQRYVTTPPAQAGGFADLPQQRLLRQRMMQPPTLTPEGPVRAVELPPSQSPQLGWIVAWIWGES